MVTDWPALTLDFFLPEALMLAPTRAIAGLMPVSVKDERITISLEINKL